MGKNIYIQNSLFISIIKCMNLQIHDLGAIWFSQALFPNWDFSLKTPSSENTTTLTVETLSVEHRGYVNHMLQACHSEKRCQEKSSSTARHYLL